MSELGAVAGARVSRPTLCDVRDPDAVEGMVAAAFADAPLDGLVNNAAGNILSPTENLSHRAVDAVWGRCSTAPPTSRSRAASDGSPRDAAPASYRSSPRTRATGSAYVVPSAMAKAGVVAMTPLSCGGVGRARHPVQRGGAGAVSHRWRLVTPVADGSAGAGVRDAQPARPAGRPSRVGQPGELSARRWLRLHQWRCDHHRRRRVAEGRGQFSALGDRLSADDWAAFRARTKR